MTPLAPADAKPPPPKTTRRASASERTAPGRRRKPPGSQRGAVPRRVSGPVAAPSLQPRPARAPQPAPGERRAPRRGTPRKRTVSARLAAFLGSLPDSPLLDRVVRGRAWIPLLGVMLVGIVAMQVELLKLNADTGRSIELIDSLQARNDVLRAQVASASNPSRIEHLAGRMGLTMPGPESITFLKARSGSVARALASIHVPNLAAFEAVLRSSGATTVPVASPSPTSAAAPTNSASQGATATPTASGAQSNSTATTTGTAAAPGTSSTNGTAAAAPGTSSTNGTAAAAPRTTSSNSTASGSPATVP